MKVQPLKKYRHPAYPTKKEFEQNRELAEKYIAQTKNIHGKLAGVMFGLGTLLAKSASGETKESEILAQIAQAYDATKKSDNQSLKATASNELKNSNATVAPILARALENDGRGAFGCVVVNPPAFLSEPEAIEIIISELEKAGLKLKTNVVIKNIATPNPDAFYSFSDEKDEFATQTEKFVVGNHTFDIATIDEKIVIEYLSCDDYSDWEGSSGSTVRTYNFPKLATKLSEEFSKYHSEDKKIFGIFFDPLASFKSGYPNIPSDKIFDDDTKLKNKMCEEFIKKSKSFGKLSQALQKKARIKLKAQVAFFIDYLKENGLMQ